MLSSSIITLDKYPVHYLFSWWTNGHTILILHGRGWSSASRKTVWAWLATLWYSVFIPDLPWFGETPLPHAYTIHDYSQRVNDFIIATKIQHWTLTVLWHSNGWRIASYGIGKGLLKADHLILMNSAGVNLSYDPSRWRRNKRKIWKTIANIMKSAKDIPWYHQLRKLLYTISGGQDYLKASDNALLKQTFVHCFEHSCESEMKHITIKTLIIRWENDTYTPLWQGKRIHDLMKTSQFIVYKDKKHGIHHTDPDRLVSDIHSFLTH